MNLEKTETDKHARLENLGEKKVPEITEVEK